MTIQEIKQRTKKTAPHYFSEGTLNFFNQTLKDFKVRKLNDTEFLNNNVRVYNNPSSGVFEIKMQNISGFKYDIYDIRGKSIMHKVEIDNNSFDIDLGNYSKGLYFLKLYSNLGSVTKKLILK